MVATVSTPAFTFAGKGVPLACPSLQTHGLCIGKCSLPSVNNAHQKNNAIICSNSKIRTIISPTSVRAIATEDGQLASAESDQKKITKYHFLVANAKFMLDEEEHFQELMSERLRMYGERNKEVDFWLVIEPKFLDKFPNITKRLRRPAVALISTNDTWIKFMKLRLDRVLEGEIEAETAEEAFASNPAELQFEKPENWTAPYPKYEYGWWKRFLPPQMDK
ncbi:hypothetical protein SUGI_0777710 [Cryptomeria japonica]|uniref:uncharacterized protein LOC131056710 isoform X1 n=1 Tax=Cryptomeria japonica TaxID=3369 RepID=UPI00241484AF|nr:uncharacterized protein LOC131056710 isoform X1 [Cryptomeria japonica]GLJ38204.1 hypothetical protein SUGI_0777710 [Cryptomeria japonica]